MKYILNIYASGFLFEHSCSVWFGTVLFLHVFIYFFIHLTVFSANRKESSCLFRLPLYDSSPQWLLVISQMMDTCFPSPWLYKCPPHCRARVRPRFLSSLSVSEQSTNVSIVLCVDGGKVPDCLLACCSAYLPSPTWSVYWQIFPAC